ncbi:MAG TPA: oxidoreductase [Nocardioidaceae bacterium]|nr:oxidoreductase [Nocardioidaceae bacterium]
MPEFGDDVFGRLASLEGVPSALAAARDAVDILLSDRRRARSTGATTAESLLLGAAASAQLAGSRASVADLRAGEGDDVALRAARLNAGLLNLVPVVGRSPAQALARLHVLAATGAVETERLGRPRPGAAVGARLAALLERLARPTTAPAIAVAALAHAEVVTVAPFESDNDLVARALERLLLVARGLDPVSSTVPEAGHLALGERYRQALRGYADGGEAGCGAWLRYAARALAEGVAASPLA